ncbi:MULTISPECIES: thiolase family protein [Kocuria]|uniref:Probable acetyl-CoA acetyltransferase n=1 Tax=Kocuria marina subsp. indica TaxID=1049583 RepID=A0A1X7CL15_9MICC|nr:MULTISPECIES: thiolase family protein [Kocuria]OXS84250.1 beta-ketoadipyl CoA thiolase [Kocuria indica]QIR69210.1 thiolase family protein [Kocuria sp. KD4]RLP58658.1 acetyl-CoA C-acyltransferase [Kocuria indica]SME98570.1 acetyl-CoA C-acetyltransferase [Kocuria indica]
MNHAYVYDAIRTPFGKVGGALASHRPDDLAALVVRTLVERAPELDPATIDEVYLGNANGAGEENRNVARMATLLAGLPVSVPGSTINRLCGSSLDAAMMGSRQIEVGEGDLLLVGGVESMSRAPWVLPKTERPYPMQNLELANTTLGWRLVNPDMPSEWTVSLGEATEQLREKHGISREDQDAFAATSHQLAAKAWDEGKYDDITVSVAPNTKKGVELTRDETVRGDSTPETLAGLRTVFRSGDNATVTAGNSSPMNDGASAVWLGSERGAQLLGREPIARIAGRGAAANEPQFFGEAPVEAANIAVRRAGITWDDVAAVELNEAFAVQSLACLRQWGVDQSIVNQWGGAIAIGHPLGASGTRVLGTLARRLQESGQRWGVASLCIGVGQGLAVVLENENAQG